MEGGLKAERWTCFNFPGTHWKVGISRLIQFYPAAAELSQLPVYLFNPVLIHPFTQLHFCSPASPLSVFFSLLWDGEAEQFLRVLLRCKDVTFPYFFSTSPKWFCLIFLLSSFPIYVSLWSPNLSHFPPSTDLMSPPSLGSRTIPVSSCHPFPEVPPVVSPWVVFSSPSPRAMSNEILFPHSQQGCWLGAPNSPNTWLDWFIYSQESIRVCKNQMRRAREALSVFPSMASTGSSLGFSCCHHYKGPDCTVASFSAKVSTKRGRETGIIWYHMSGNSVQMENGEERHTDVFSSKLLGNN